MTKEVNDEVLGRFARQQHDLFERVCKGSLDPEAIYQAVNPLLKRGRKVENTYSILRPIKSGLVIPATDGKRTFATATNTFPGGIYGESCDVVGKARPETLVVVHELIEDGAFQRIFDGQGVPFKKLCLTEDQIIQFVITHQQHLHPKGYATLFLFQVAGRPLVAGVRWRDARRLEVDVDHLADDYVWDADGRNRVVLPASPRLRRGVPQLALKPS